jgi:hypothetical protein
MSLAQLKLENAIPVSAWNIKVIFRPKPSVRLLDSDAVFCAGSPQLQPHVAMSQSLSALHSLAVPVELESGCYTLRSCPIFPVAENWSSLRLSTKTPWYKPFSQKMPERMPCNALPVT